MDEKIKIIKDIEKYIAFWFVTQEAITDYKAEVEEEIKKRKRAYATALYNAGYRKESDTAREILQMIDSIPTNEVNELNHLWLFKKSIAEKYGVDLGE